MAVVSDQVMGAVIAQSKELLLLLDPVDLNFVYSNSAAELSLGYEPGEICQLSPHLLLPEFLAPELRDLIEGLASDSKQSMSMSTVLVSKLAGLRDYVLQLQYVDIEGQSMLLIVGHDVTDRMAEADQMQEMLADAQMESMLDPGTGLMQRICFLPYLMGGMSRSVESKKPYGLMLLEIKNLSEINTKYGKQVGGKILVHIGQIVKHMVETPEFSARFSGNKMCLLLPDANKGSIQTLVKHLMRAIGRLSYPNYPDLAVKSRLGIFFGREEVDPEALLEQIAIEYRSKREQKDDLLILLTPKMPEQIATEDSDC